MAGSENGDDRTSRREALALGVAGGGFGVASMLGGSLARAQRRTA